MHKILCYAELTLLAVSHARDLFVLLRRNIAVHDEGLKRFVVEDLLLVAGLEICKHDKFPPL